MRRTVLAALASVSILSVILVILLRNCTSRGPASHFRIQGEIGFVTGASLSPDGTILATVGWDRSLVLWETTNWNEKKRIPVDRGFPASVHYVSDHAILVGSGWGHYGSKGTPKNQLSDLNSGDYFSGGWDLFDTRPLVQRRGEDTSGGGVTRFLATADSARFVGLVRHNGSVRQLIHIDVNPLRLHGSAPSSPRGEVSRRSAI